MTDTKAHNLHIENEVIHPHHVREIDQGNNAVLLDIGVDDEKGDAGSLKLAKDRHVCSQNTTESPQIPGADNIRRLS
jgi:hypothetical protein